MKSTEVGIRISGIVMIFCVVMFTYFAIQMMMYKYEPTEKDYFCSSFAEKAVSELPVKCKDYNFNYLYYR